LGFVDTTYKFSWFGSQLGRNFFYPKPPGSVVFSELPNFGGEHTGGRTLDVEGSGNRKGPDEEGVDGAPSGVKKSRKTVRCGGGCGI